jgi:hypothetical protein
MRYKKLLKYLALFLLIFMAFVVIILSRNVFFLVIGSRSDGYFQNKDCNNLFKVVVTKQVVQCGEVWIMFKTDTSRDDIMELHRKYHFATTYVSGYNSNITVPRGKELEYSEMLKKESIVFSAGPLSAGPVTGFPAK